MKRSLNRSHFSPSRGLSLLEVVIASALLMVIALGVLPLMLRSLTNNNQGWESSQVSNHFRNIFDTALDLAFDGPPMTVPVAETELLTQDFYTFGDLEKLGDEDEGWWLPADLGVADGDSLERGADSTRGTVEWIRATRVRQFNIDDLGNLDDPDNLPFDEPLPGGEPEDGGVPRDFIHLKEIRVEIRKGNAADGIFDPATRYSIILYKAF